MRELLRDITRYLLRIDGKFVRTLRLLFSPGRLTREYLAGRRERYERPFRFYLVIFIAMRRVYGEGWFGTLSRFFFVYGGATVVMGLLATGLIIAVTVNGL